MATARSEERTALTDARPAASVAMAMAAEAQEETTHVAIASMAAAGPARHTQSLVRESVQEVLLTGPKLSGSTRQLMTHEGWCRDPGTVPRVQMPWGAVEVKGTATVGVAAETVEITGAGAPPPMMVVWALIRDEARLRSRTPMACMKIAVMVRRGSNGADLE